MVLEVDLIDLNGFDTRWPVCHAPLIALDLPAHQLVLHVDSINLARRVLVLQGHWRLLVMAAVTHLHHLLLSNLIRCCQLLLVFHD